MKTKNNVQKAVLKSLAVLTGLVLLSNTINAQGLWRMGYMNDNADDEISLAMTGDRYEVLTAMTSAKSSINYNSVYSFTIEEKENEMELESWMTDADFFAAGNYSEEEVESPMMLESWMTNKTYFEMSSYLMNETDEALQVEDWMLDEKVFQANETTPPQTENQLVGKKVYSTKNFVYSELKDPELKFEAWMFDTRHWGIK